MHFALLRCWDSEMESDGSTLTNSPPVVRKQIRVTRLEIFRLPLRVENGRKYSLCREL
jgi:hypothetical protein